jgi:chromosome segregation protein
MTFASWKKCDFQVHTPRDPNWQGSRPIGEGDLLPESDIAASAADVDLGRKRWAKDFVDACVRRGLQAIALTDHHETVMVPFVRAEIAARKEADTAFDLWLFPGMELTTSNGRQCLILFDADISDDLCREVRGRLGISDGSLNVNQAQGPAVTQLAIHYPDISAEIDKLNGISGRYIILPNISEGNKHTVLVKGTHGEFSRMPYIGGYLDSGQTIDSLGSKNRKRISGKYNKWSVREIYPLPTSDSRTADFAKLGKNDTWIKLAEPTAEAIRQAFLGHPSRIRIEAPSIPALAVAHIEIVDSTILEPTAINLSPEFNSIIGGRGSGKSSFLEYFSFGLGRSCFDSKRDDYSGSSRLQELVSDTLISKSGHVTLTLLQDNATFKITRSPSTAHQPQVTYPDGSVQNVTTQELRSLFPAVVYSQGELAEIGKQTGKKTQLTDLLQFVNPDYKREDDRLLAAIEVSKENVRKAIQARASAWGLQARQRKMLAQRDSLRQRVKALEKTLPALSEEDQAIIDKFDQADTFESQRIQASKHADQILQEMQASISELLSARDLSAAQDDQAKAFQQRYGNLFTSFDTGIRALEVDIKEHRQTMTVAEENWTKSFAAMSVARDKVLEKLSAHTTATNQIKKLREEITELNNQLGDLEAELKAAGDPTEKLTAATAALRAATDERMARTKQWAGEIETLSSGKIKASVDESGDISGIEDAIELVSNKTGSQEATRMRALESELESESVWDVLDRLRTDCLALLYWRLVGAATGEGQPPAASLMGVLGDTDRIRSALIEKLDSARVEAIATAVPKPEIALSYCDGGREISFEKASEGQRAAALLFMLLEQPGGPLIIDQPEGDLDNRIIAELTDKLHTAKQKRQLIFASHNANIVVNGSSELVGYIDVNNEGCRQFEFAGAIDKPEICNVITATMEGGEKAFKDRQSKYGY